MPDLKLNREKLLDKLGERYLYERKTVGIYDKIMEKLESVGFDQGIEQLQEYRNQEREHQKMLDEYIKQLGGSTRRKTPSQMLVEAESNAFENIVNSSDDPYMLLHVLLDAELGDNASWELLIALAKRAGQNDFVSTFQEALEHERNHLKGVRTMVTKIARQELMEQPGAR